MSGPLDGLKVVDFTRMLPGPYCTHLLADMGADVVKVEDAERGDPMRLLPPFLPTGMSVPFLNINKNKRAVAVDFNSSARFEIFGKLAEWADVVVEQYRPGVMDKIGLGYEDAGKVNSRIIYCSITGYGQNGPYKDDPGHDLNFMAFSGLLDTLTPPDLPLSVCPVQISDLTGGMMGAVSILAAYYEMLKTGRGSHIDVSLLDVTVSMLPLHMQGLSDAAGSSFGADLFLKGRAPWYNVYKSADGHMAVGAIENKFWVRLCELLGKPEYGEKQYVTDSFEEITGWLEAEFRKKSNSEWMELFSEEEVCVSPVNSVADMARDPQVRARGMISDVNYENIGKATVISTPFDNGKDRMEEGCPAPVLGQHTRELLGTVGFGFDEIESFVRSGTVVQG